MRDIYLGDSYDIVKRYWADQLRDVAPLVAHHRFIPLAIRNQFQQITTIPVVETAPTEPFGLLFDPHTGIPFPTDGSTRPTASHSPIEFVVDTMREWCPTYLIAFDQSYHRRHELSRTEQRAAKMAALNREQIKSFYYVSHAPFMFCASNLDTISRLVGRLIQLGIPESRIERNAAEIG